MYIQYWTFHWKSRWFQLQIVFQTLYTFYRLVIWCVWSSAQSLRMCAQSCQIIDKTPYTTLGDSFLRSCAQCDAYNTQIYYIIHVYDARVRWQISRAVSRARIADNLSPALRAHIRVYTCRLVFRSGNRFLSLSLSVLLVYTSPRTSIDSVTGDPFVGSLYACGPEKKGARARVQSKTVFFRRFSRFFSSPFTCIIYYVYIYIYMSLKCVYDWCTTIFYYFFVLFFKRTTFYSRKMDTHTHTNVSNIRIILCPCLYT